MNIDLLRSVHPDLVVDLRGGLPVPAGSLRYVYSEHVMEHLELADAKQLLRDIYVGLEPGGTMRIAMPDLDEVISRYQGDWRDQVWLQDPGFAYIDTPTHMFNVSIREWGHKYMYGIDELRLRVAEAGFETIESCAHGQSPHESLRNLETRADSLLIVEATKTPR